MFLLDDLVLLPSRGLLWIAREITQAAQQEQADEAEAITIELSRLYMKLESEQLAEAEFDAREKDLLDRLEQIEQRESVPGRTLMPA